MSFEYPITKYDANCKLFNKQSDVPTKKLVKLLPSELHLKVYRVSDKLIQKKKDEIRKFWDT